MKKTLFKTTILAIILVAAILGTTVNAGSVTAPETVKAGEEVTVNINVDTAMENADITMTYDATKLEYKDKSATAGENMFVQVNADEAGKLIIAVAGGDNTTKTVSVTFIAKEDITGDAAVAVTSFEANTNETLANTTVTIKAAEEAKDPVKDPDKEPDKKPTDDNKKPTGTDGKPITKLPQTGAPVFAGAIALVVLTAGAIVLVKRAK